MTRKYRPRPVVLCILDGWGESASDDHNAIRLADTPAWDGFMRNCPHAWIDASELHVGLPEGQMGTITGDLAGKRGRIEGTDILPGGLAVVKARAPLSEVMQYQSQLKSVTGGQGSFAMEFSHYEPVPPQVQQQIASQYQPKVEED